MCFYPCCVLTEEQKFLSSREADDLFHRLDTAEPSVVIDELAFLTDYSFVGDQPPVFEYDTDLNHAFYLLGLAYEKNAFYSKSSECFQKAIEAWPQDVESYVAVSNVEDNLELQVEILERGVQFCPDPRILLNLAHAYGDLQLLGKALKMLQRISPTWEQYDLVTFSIDKIGRRIT